MDFGSTNLSIRYSQANYLDQGAKWTLNEKLFWTYHIFPFYIDDTFLFFVTISSLSLYFFRFKYLSDHLASNFEINTF